MKKDPSNDNSNNSPLTPVRQSVQQLKALHVAKVNETGLPKAAPKTGAPKKPREQGGAVPPKSQPAATKSIFTAEELESRRKNREALKLALQSPSQPAPRKVISTGLNKALFNQRKESIQKQIEVQLFGNRVEMRGQVKEAVKEAYAEKMRVVLREQAYSQIVGEEFSDAGAGNNNNSPASDSATATNSIKAKQATLAAVLSQSMSATMGQVEAAKPPRATHFAVITPVAAEARKSAAARQVKIDLVTMEFCRNAVAIKLPAGYVVTVADIADTMDSFITHARAYNFDFDKEENLVNYATDISLLRSFLDADPELGANVFYSFDSEMMGDLKKSIMVAISPSVREKVAANAINADGAGYDGSVREYVNQVKTVDLLLSGNEEALRAMFFNN